MPRTGFIDHIGIGVPDLGAAKQYYDELMSVLGLREWFDTGPGGPLNYGPDGGQGAQLFFYQAEEPATYSRHQTGLHHLAFLVESRAVVREAHEWARARDATILDEPGEFPQYGPHCFAAYWLDPHGIKLEAVCHTPEESWALSRRACGGPSAGRASAGGPAPARQGRRRRATAHRPS